MGVLTVQRYLALLEKSFVIVCLHGFSRNLLCSQIRVLPALEDMFGLENELN